MGGFTFDIGVGVPVDILGWMMQLLPAACAIALERSTVRLSRGDYIMALIVYPVGCVALVFLASIVAMAAGYEDEQNFSFFLGYRDIILLNPISMGALGIEALFRFLVARLIVRRLRDGRIAKKWAYLTLLPFIDLILVLGLTVYPPTRTPAAAPAEPATQTL